ncbi:hypothetical protein CDAR_416191 [Caerostris darwini]|uniref:Uncharacterized protein n=1 Tax=Caerostris darwini TaxID=1538125 RepID=A0AAV4W4H8_9ARAC|nr:hypothetical protein CDAR_416191 [Caerostris darwini]
MSGHKNLLFLFRNGPPKEDSKGPKFLRASKRLLSEKRFNTLNWRFMAIPDLLPAAGRRRRRGLGVDLFCDLLEQEERFRMVSWGLMRLDNWEIKDLNTFGLSQNPMHIGERKGRDTLKGNYENM